jgi:hypothetical protein
MEGVVDESVSQQDGQLADLGAAAITPPPPVPANLAALSAKDLQAARVAWTARADAAFGALNGVQDELADLDDSRQDLAGQIDQVGDLLARLGKGESVSMPAELGPVILYGRGWHRANDPAKMGAAFRELRAQARAAAAAGSRPARRPRAATSATTTKAATTTADAQPFDAWAGAHKLTAGRMAVLEALAGLERWRGFYDALAGTMQQQLVELRVQAEQACAVRGAVAAEIQRRALEGGAK